MTPEEALRQSLDNLALRVTTSRGGYVGGGQPHATIPSDPGAVEQLAQSLAARLPALPVPALDAERLAIELWKVVSSKEPDWDGEPFTDEDWVTLNIESERDEYRQIVRAALGEDVT